MMHATYDHRSGWVRLSVLLTAVALAFAAALLHLQPAQADNHIDPITVGGGGDHATVQEALDNVLDGGTIEVAVGTYTESLTVPADLTVIIVGQGGAMADTVLEGVDASGLPTLVIPSTSTVTLENLRVTGGERSGIENHGTLTLDPALVSGNEVTVVADPPPGTQHGGGGILNFAGATLTVTTGTVIEANTAAGPGGSFPNGGGIANYGTLTITGGAVQGNTAGNVGGGIYNNFAGTMTISGNTTISGNHATTGGGGIFNSGYTREGSFQGSGTITGAGVTVTTNTTDGDGGGIYSYGQLTVTDATISNNTADDDGNQAGNGGGIFTYGTSDPEFTAILGRLETSGVTVTGNQGQNGGGLYLNGFAHITGVTAISGNAAVGDFGTGGGIYRGGSQ